MRRIGAILLLFAPGLAQEEGISPCLDCPAVESAIRLDGRLAEAAWRKAPGLPMGRIEQVHPAFRERWKGPRDLSARVHALRSGPDLVLGFEITDDATLHEAGRAWWTGDSIEVFLDTDLATEEDDSAYSGDDLQLFLMPFHEGPRWGVVSRGPGVPYPDAGLRGIEVASARGQGGYSVEARIPLANFESLRPDAEGRIGFDVALNDVDEPGADRTETYMTLSGRFDLYLDPRKFGRLALGLPPPGPAAAPPSGGFDWQTLLLGLAGVAGVALLGRRAARRFVRRTRLRLMTLCALAAAAAALLTFAPSLVAILDDQAVRQAAQPALARAEAAARAHLALDATPPAARAENLLALLRDGQVRIQPHYRYLMLPLTPAERRTPEATRYGIRLAPGESRSFPLEGLRAPPMLRLDLGVPEPGERQAAALPAAEVRLELEEGEPLVCASGRAEREQVLLDAGDRAGAPLRALHVRNLLSFQPLVVHGLFAEREALPLAVRTPSGVPLDVWQGTPATHILQVGRGARHTVELGGVTGHRLWVAVGAGGAYPASAYGADAVRIRVHYGGAQRGPEHVLRNGIDVRDHLLAYADATGDRSSVALAWEDAARLPVHYSLHAIDLDPGRAVERLEVEDLGVLASLHVAAATLGILDAAAPPAGSGLSLAGDRLSVDADARELWSGSGLRVHAPDGAVHAFGPAEGVAVPRELPFAPDERGQLVVVFPRGTWALAILRARGAVYGAAALCLALSAMLAGAALLQRARHLRVKMLVALGAATVVPLLFLVVGLSRELGARAEETLRQATLSDLDGVRERIRNARAEVSGLAARIRDTLEFVRPQGAEALSHQLRRARDEAGAEGAFLRVPELADDAPAPLGNVRLVDAFARPGLYYSPWDGILAIGVAGTVDRYRCVVGVRNAALLGSAFAPDVEAVLFGPEGEALASTRAVPEELKSPHAWAEARDRVRSLALDATPLFESRAVLRGEPVAAAWQRLVDGGRTLGALAVYRSRRATEETKAAILRTILLSGLAALALVVLAGGTLVDRVTQRLRRVTKAARALAHGRLASRVPVESADEVGRLAASFNRMADALDERLRQLTELHGGLQDLTAALARDEVAQVAARVLARATGAKHVLIASFDRATEQLETLHREGEGAPLGTRLPANGPVRDAVSGPEPVLSEGRLVLPLLARGRTVGVALCSPVGEGAGIDARFLDASGRQIGIALENARLYHAAVTDEATGLYTHAFLVRRLKEEVDRASATGRSVSLLRVLLADYEGMALRRGPSGASRLVAEAATVLRGTLPRRDMVARGEGGELLALLVESDAGEARRFTEEIAAALRRHAFRTLAGESAPEFLYRSVTYPGDGASAGMLLDALSGLPASGERPAEDPSAPLRVPLRLGVVLGRSPGMRAALEVVARVAPTQATVLFSGETGTGKEVLADLCQANSGRRDGPYVKVNCAAIPETLLEAELFGHERGAFTGADRRRIGRFEEAHRGTLLLDEIGDLPLPMQAKLLRFLQEPRITRVGGTAPLDVDVRILAASNRDLAESVRRGSFREDLYHRLHVIELRVPPLRERREDIPGLIDHFRRHFNARHGIEVQAFSPDALDRLYRHDWPGNVRELKNVVERSMLLAGSPVVERRHLSLPDPAGGAEPPAAPVDGLSPRQERILGRARAGGGVTNGDIVSAERVSARTALRELQHLVDRGLLVRIGRRRGAVYKPGD